MKYFLAELEEAGFDKCESMVALYINSMAKYLKSTEQSYNDKIKFLLIESADDYRGIGILNVQSNPKPKLPVKKTAGNKKGPIKIEYEADFYDKNVIIPSNIDTNKMLLFNPHFEKMLRHNIIDCCHLISKIEPDRDNMKIEFENFVDNFEKNFLNKIALSFNNLHIFEFEVNM